MKTKIVSVLAGLLLACVMTISNAAEDQIVIDDLTPSQLRAEIKKIETELYRVWNSLNTIDELAIVCHEYTPTGSNIKREACEPQFVIDRRGRNAADSTQFTDELLTPAGLRADLSGKFEELTDAMNALAAENKYFKDLNTILSVLRERLEEL